MQRLNAIENLEIKHNEASLRDKMKKLDDLDEYTRTKIKNEINAERVNYATARKFSQISQTSFSSLDSVYF